MGEGYFTDACKKFMHDPEAVGALSHSVPLASLSFPDAFDTIYIAGGHGCCNPDFYTSSVLISAIETTLFAGKVVAVVCHGPMVLAQCKNASGAPLVSGLSVTGFSNSEEAAVGCTDKVDFLIQTKFEEQGGNFEKADDWTSGVVSDKVGDGTLVTGQNPQSSEACAKLVIDCLGTTS